MQVDPGASSSPPRIRPCLASFASCLIYPWLHSNASLESILAVKRAVSASACDGFVRKSLLAAALGVDEDQMNVLLDILSDVSDTGVDSRGLVSTGQGEETVDLARILLLISVHVHLKRQGKSSDDLWPSPNTHQNYHHQMEPSSPLKLHAKSFAPGSQSSQDAVGVSYEHIQHETRRLSEFLAVHVEDILQLISDGDGVEPTSAHEVARLSFLLTAPILLGSGGDIAQRVREAFARATPATSAGNGNSTGSGSEGFPGSPASGRMTRSSSVDRPDGAGATDMETAGTTLPSLANISTVVAPGSSDGGDEHDVLIQGVHKVTVIRGEEEILGADSVRILDCHDSVIYILAPIKWCQVVSCTNSIVVLGAVGQSLRIEYCERLQVVAVTSHTVINTCHDCIVYAASNRTPLMVGDNRFVQLAPYNSGYDNLERHMEISGISPDVNRWDAPVTLMPEKPVFKHYPQENLRVQHQLDHSKSVTLLPPEKIMPFVIPFKGGAGPLCGGAAAPLTRGTSNDTLTGLLTQEFVDFCPCPFPLPEVYVAAWKSRMAGIATVKEAYKHAKLSTEQKQAFTSAVQRYFKEWLQHGGGMREVYDLAKVEKGRKRR